jgi:hypothetical protein
LKDVDSNPLPQLDETKKQVLGPDIIVVEAVRFLAGKSKDLLRAGVKFIISCDRVLL